MNGSRYQRYIVLLNKKLIYYDEIRNITDAIAAIHKTIKLIQTYRAMLSLFHPWSFTLKFKDVFSMFIICCIKTFPREKFAKSQLFDLFNHVQCAYPNGSSRSKKPRNIDGFSTFVAVFVNFDCDLFVFIQKAVYTCGEFFSHITHSKPYKLLKRMEVIYLHTFIHLRFQKWFMIFFGDLKGNKCQVVQCTLERLIFPIKTYM